MTATNYFTVTVDDGSKLTRRYVFFDDSSLSDTANAYAKVRRMFGVRKVVLWRASSFRGPWSNHCFVGETPVLS